MSSKKHNGTSLSPPNRRQHLNSLSGIEAPVLGAETEIAFPESPIYYKADLIVVFDGVCNFCNGWVAFISKRDRRNRFKFAFAQSNSGGLLLKNSKFSPDDLETILLVSQDRTFVKSDAIIMIMSGLGGVWRTACILKIIPRKWRDAVYSLIARNRYLIAGRVKACKVPPDVDAEKFIL